jgi:hypothetical protein
MIENTTINNDVVEDSLIVEEETTDLVVEEETSEDFNNDGENKIEEEPVNVKKSSKDSYVYPLNLIPSKGLVLDEFGKHEYCFERLTVLGQESGYYLAACKHKDVGWEKAAIVAPLSDRYCVLSLDGYVQRFKDEFGITEDPIVFSNKMFVLSARMKVNTGVTVFDNDFASTLFSMISGAPEQTLHNLTCELYVQLTNSYNGTRSLVQDYILYFTSKTDNKTYSFKDYFSLFNARQKIDHFGNMDTLNDPKDVIQSVKEHINKLKAIENIKDIQGEIAAPLHKDLKGRFNSLCDGCVGDYDNAFYMLAMLSVAIEQDFDNRNYLTATNAVSRVLSNYLS